MTDVALIGGILFTDITLIGGMLYLGIAIVVFVRMMSMGLRDDFRKVKHSFSSRTTTIEHDPTRGALKTFAIGVSPMIQSKFAEKEIGNRSDLAL